MSKSRLKNDSQLSIFALLQRASETATTTEGRFRVIERLRGALRNAIKGSPLSRHQIAGEMSHLLGETITKEMIDSWTRGSGEINGRPGRHIPAEYLPAFCEATKSIEPIRLLGELGGFFVFPGTEAMRAEIHRLKEKAKGLQKEIRKRESFLSALMEDTR